MTKKSKKSTRKSTRKKKNKKEWKKKQEKPDTIDQEKPDTIKYVDSRGNFIDKEDHEAAIDRKKHFEKVAKIQENLDITTLLNLLVRKMRKEFNLHFIKKCDEDIIRDAVIQKVIYMVSEVKKRVALREWTEISQEEKYKNEIVR